MPTAGPRELAYTPVLRCRSAVCALVEPTPGWVVALDRGGELRWTGGAQGLVVGAGVRLCAWQGSALLVQERGLLTLRRHGGATRTRLAPVTDAVVSGGQLWVALGDGGLLRGPTPEALTPTPWSPRRPITALAEAPWGVLVAERGLCELLWTAGCGEPRRLGGMQDAPRAVATSPRWLAWQDGVVLGVMTLDDNLDSAVCAGPEQAGVERLCFTGDGRWLVSAGPRGLRVWSPSPLAARAAEVQAPVTALAPALEGGVWCGDADGGVRRFIPPG